MEKRTHSSLLDSRNSGYYLTLIYKYQDILVILGIFIYALIIWWPTKLLPYHWDSAGFVINAARNLLATHFQPLIVSGSDFAHPPFFITLLAFAWQVFGTSFLTSHIVMFPFLPLLIGSVYFIGKKTTASPLISIPSAVLTGMLPFVVSEYGLIYIDLPMAALALTALAFWLYNKPMLSAIFLSLAALIKLPALLLIPIFVYITLSTKHERKTKLTTLSFLCIPIFIVILWLIYHHNLTGWWLTIPGRPTNFPKSFTQAYLSFSYIGDAIFIKQARWLLTLSGGLSIIILAYRKIRGVLSKEILGLLGFLLISFVFFIVMGEFGMRYSIFFIPSFIILVLYFSLQAIRNHTAYIALISLFMLAFFLSWHPNLPTTSKYEFQASEDQSYLDLIFIGQKAAKTVEVNFPQAHVYGSFPESYQLTQPYQGYVHSSIMFSECGDFAPDPTSIQLIYVHPFSPGQINCRRLLDLVPTQAIQHFESNGKWVEIYKVSPPPATVPSKK